MAAGDLPGIFLTSQERPLVRFRKKVLAQRGMTPAAFRDALGEAIRSEPLHLAPAIDARTTLLIVTVFDRIVGLRQELKFREALGRPLTVFVPLGHYSAVLMLPILRVQARLFFRRAFELEAPERRARPSPFAPRHLPGRGR